MKGGEWWYFRTGGSKWGYDWVGPFDNREHAHVARDWVRTQGMWAGDVWEWVGLTRNDRAVLVERGQAPKGWAQMEKMGR